MNAHTPTPSIKHDLTFALLMSSLVFVCALAWGHPLIGAGSAAQVAATPVEPAQQSRSQPIQTQQAHAQPAQAQPVHAQPVQAQPAQTQSAIFSGTVQRNGEQFFLREVSGQIYRLDDPQQAQQYEGQAVKVTGKLDTQAKLIHVEHIEPVMS